MVKRQKEKQYQSATEQKANSQLRSGSSNQQNSQTQRRLPFDCCALTLSKIEDPVCTPNGILFETTALLPFLLKHKVDPVTGEAMTSKDVISLNIDKDEEGRWQCPIITKVLSDHMKVVAVAIKSGTAANVYSWQAYHELNVKTKNYQDLISGEKFNPKQDVILLNNPDDEDFQKLRDINNFHHIRHGRTLERDTKPSSNVQHSVTAARIMAKIQKHQQTQQQKSETKPIATTTTTETPKYLAEAVIGYRLTSGIASSSLTSTSSILEPTNAAREATLEEILQAQFKVMRSRKQKGFCTLHTNMGDIGIELHCDIVPRTCINFLGLAEQKQYDGSSFHRLIPTFMIQGGKGGTDDSLWGEDFADEFDDRLTHASEGILSMANAGPGTNKRQFFLTFQATPHLDRKHSVFGRIIKGIEVVHEMKKVPTDKKGRPIHSIVIESIEVLVNPAKEAQELERIRIEGRMKEIREAETTRTSKSLGGGVTKRKEHFVDTPVAVDSTPVIGKYLNSLPVDNAETAPVSRLKPPPKKTKFGNFSGW
jgi:peptidyl-prolyl cis-trans isomerase-like protein 2